MKHNTHTLATKKPTHQNFKKQTNKETCNLIIATYIESKLKQHTMHEKKKKKNHNFEREIRHNNHKTNYNSLNNQFSKI